AAFADRAYMALSLRRRPNDQMRLFELSNMAEAAGVPTVVTNDVLFHVPERRMLQDVVTCIRHNCTIDEAGFRRERHADRYMKPPQEMHRLFTRYPEALSRSLEIAKRCKFSLKELVYQYPEERTQPGLTAQQALEKMVWEAA
ncbi:error-prone DNA polymerase, partial [Rhizobium sp. BR5]